MLLCKPSIFFTQATPSKTPTVYPSRNPRRHIVISMASNRRRTMSALEARISLVFALASQTSSLSQRRICFSHLLYSVSLLGQLVSASMTFFFIIPLSSSHAVLVDFASETAKYLFPKRFETRSLEEALMSVPDLETIKFRVLSRTDQYEIREVEPYFIAETTMPGKTGFDFNGASQSFNVLAEYLFGKNTTKEKMEMTTPVFTRTAQSDGKKMEMTTPVITKRVEGQDEWRMSFLMPSKYGANLPSPKDPSVRITEVPRKIVAVVAFSGFVTDEDVKQRETKLREALKNDRQFQVKEGTSVEIAQYNPPFTLPFQRRNEIALEVESKDE